ncbi:uncharacterized protein I206_106604 [Kwoniella pini CBS 10737]|uniref:Uncharacterized protein n=1 Tax=Kwoniella pini CBS 10737 TaxID=1296096 RepID=A0A1B9HTQ5_9TREE|nr:uncharacterized protein I206_07505 [Kwoniella pini CBS 10737]OCF46652.1 hypothetical protein I206_07505 [Kwoniella pini CBS 10737]
MTSLARPINFPSSSRPSYDRSISESPSPSSSPKSSTIELGSSPTKQQHPCPHLNQFVQTLVKAYWGQEGTSQKR